jgi:hypothetical protein
MIGIGSNPLVAKVFEYRRDCGWDDNTVRIALQFSHGQSSAQIDEIIAEANAPKPETPPNGHSTQQEIMTAATIEPTEEKQPPSLAVIAPLVSAEPVDYYAETVCRLRKDSSERSVREIKRWLQLQGVMPQQARDFIEKAMAEIQIASAPILKVPPTFFESIALPLVGRGWKVAPCYPWNKVRASDGKILGKTVHGGLVPEPLTMRSADPAKIQEWGLAEPNANVCLYAEQVEGGMLFLDKDGAVSLREKYERETGKKFDQTLLVRSSVVDDGNGGIIAKGHWYFLQTPRTLALRGNIPESKTGGLFSLRVSNEYVVTIGSIHPTGKPYEIAEDFPVAPMSSDLLDWLLAQVVDTPKTRQEIVERGKFAKGTRYSALMSEAGRLWNRGYSREDTIETAIKWARAYFDVPEGTFNENLVRKEIEHLIDTYEQGDPTRGVIGLTQGAESVVSNAPTVGSEEWPALTPLDDLLSPVPPFDLDFLPLSIQPWGRDVSERMGVPLDFSGICALVTLAGVVGRRAFVYPKAFDKEWKESISLSGAVAAHSGRIKTPTWKTFTNIVVEQEIDWKKEHSKRMGQYLKDLENWQNLQKVNKKTKENSPSADVMLASEPQKPAPCRCVMLNDATPEAMHATMEENPEGLLYYRDELSGWVAELDKDGRESQRDMFLAAMNGNDPHSVKRIGRGNVFAIMCASVFGGFQPDMLIDFLSESRNISSGLIPRFILMAWPDELECPAVDRVANEIAKQGFRGVVRNLMAMKAESVSMHFNSEAQSIFNNWLAEHIRKTDAEENTGKQSHLSKYKGGLPKIAALLQLVDLVALGGTFTGNHLIDAKHIQQAIAFLRYLEAHMHRVYDSRREGLQQIETLLAKRIAKGAIKDGMSAREIQLKGWRNLDNTDRIEGALINLAEHGWVREAPPSNRPGRPTVRWEVNPAVREKGN